MGYPVGNVQEAEKDTDLDLMLRNGWWEQVIKTWGVFRTQVRRRGPAQDRRVSVNTGPSGKRWSWRRAKANEWQNPQGHGYFRGKGKKQHQTAATLLGDGREERKDRSESMDYQLRKNRKPSLLPHSFP